MAQPLEGRTIALAEGRQIEELAGLLEKEGAKTLRCPMVSILDAPDSAPVVAWLRQLISGSFEYVILLTGEALRRLLSVAEREGIRNEAIAALGKTRTITRGPKPVRALKEVGLAPSKIADVPTTTGVIAALAQETLRGVTVGVTLYGEPNPALEHYLLEQGATVHTVLPYIYAPGADAERVAMLLEQMAAGQVDVILFTSSPQVDRLYEVARERNQLAELQNGLKRTRVAAIGPVVAENLREHGAGVDICPEQGFVMKNLVQQIKRALAATPS